MHEQQDRVSGTVVNANEWGFQFSGAESWLNWSKYATEPRTLPAPGERIVAMLDKAGYVRSVLRAEGTKVVAPSTAAPLQQAARNPQLDRQFRLDCLKLVMSYPDVFSGLLDSEAGLLQLAEALQAWSEGRK